MLLYALVLMVALATVVFAAMVLRSAIVRRARPHPEAVALGAVTNFFDALGIGCFAPTLAWMKLRGLTPDRLIPPTMMVGHGLPTMAQALIFLILLGVAVDPVLIAGCAVALTLGAWIGVPLVAKSRVAVIQAVVGVALLAAAVFYALANLGLMPGGGTAASLPPPLMALAIAAMFVFGVLLNFGVGNYAPSLAMLGLMGMDPRLVFPIMATGGALSLVGAGVRHVQAGQIDMRLVGGLALGGVPAVLVAALLVKEMPLELLRWLVAAVVVYAGLVMLQAAAKSWKAEAAQATA